MTRARWQGGEYELLNFTEDAEYVLRTPAGDTYVFEESEHQRVEIQCERCRRWTKNIAKVGPRWVCADTGCYGAQLAEG